MAQSNMVIFNKYVPETAVELLAQMVEKFNASSNGSILLTNQGFEGDFFERSFYSSLESAQRRVDRYATNGAASATSLAA
ncbi:MAG: major capsid protein, partial [Sulfurospirillum sp.]